MTSATSPTRGVLLAGGHGTRLHPMTKVMRKHLLPIFDKPMIFYPLSTLFSVGVREIVVVCRDIDRPSFERLLEDGSAWGGSIRYASQNEPRGIAEALRIAADFIACHRVVFALGDNLLHGAEGELQRSVRQTSDGEATILAVRVRNPAAYGVIEFEAETNRPLSIEEKSSVPRSPLAVPSRHVYGAGVEVPLQRLRPSARGEGEITDLHSHYLEAGRVKVLPLPGGSAWFDSGTPEGLLEASLCVQAIQERQGVTIGVLEAQA
ncbi:MAG: NTP transferase domain-containing protein [Planctomycetes bacterium]|nr:NTP transferase domain-containing protein [Planctomycetota bacterium]